MTTTTTTETSQTTETTIDGRTAAEWEAIAHDHLRRRGESIERSDEDGFVSQHFAGLSAHEAERNAEIAANCGRAEFVGLYQGDRRVLARIVDGQYGQQWELHASEGDLIAKRGKRWLPTGATSRILRGLGLAERVELAPAKARVWAPEDARGFGGMHECRVIADRTGDEWGGDAEIAPPAVVMEIACVDATSPSVAYRVDADEERFARGHGLLALYDCLAPQTERLVRVRFATADEHSLMRR